MKTIVALGDSLTFGYCVTEENKWVNIINKSLKQNHIDVKIINSGINGDTTRAMYQRLNQDVLSYNPFEVVMWSGANDFYFNTYPFEDTLKYFEKITQSLNKNFIKVNYILGPDVNLNLALTEIECATLKSMLVKFEKLKQFFDKNDYKYLDLRNIFHSENNEDYFIDTIHFNNKGSKIIADKIYTYIVDKIIK